MKKFLLILFITVASTSHAWTHLSSNIKGWASKNVVFYVNTTNCTIPDAQLFDILDAAIGAWNGVTNSGLKVSRAATQVTTTVDEFNNREATQVPVIVCDPNMAEADYIPGITTNTYLNSSGNIIYSGIMLNANTSGAAELSKLTRAELEVTIAHEMGHVLGLGHSSDAKALMYFSIGDKPTAILTQDDMDGVTHIYPRSDFSDGAFGCSSVHPEHVGDAPTWFLIGLFFTVSNIWMWRRRLERPL